MFIFLVILIAVLAVLLTLVVLLQSGRGGGLAGIAAGAQTTQILGARQAPDILEKATWTLAALFIVLCVLANFAIDRSEVQESVIQRQAQGTTEQATPVLPPADGQPLAPQQAQPAPTQPDPVGGNE